MTVKFALSSVLIAKLLPLNFKKFHNEKFKLNLAKETKSFKKVGQYYSYQSFSEIQPTSWILI